MRARAETQVETQPELLAQMAEWLALLAVPTQLLSQILVAAAAEVRQTLLRDLQAAHPSWVAAAVEAEVLKIPPQPIKLGAQEGNLALLGLTPQRAVQT